MVESRISELLKHNVILSQLHVAMLRFHNAVIDRLRADLANAGDSAEQIFREARRQVRRHYQWVIVHEFLPLRLGKSASMTSCGKESASITSIEIIR